MHSESGVAGVRAGTGLLGHRPLALPEGLLHGSLCNYGQLGALLNALLCYFTMKLNMMAKRGRDGKCTCEDLGLFTYFLVKHLSCFSPNADVMGGFPPVPGLV